MGWLDSIWAVIGTGFGIFASVNALFFKADDFFSKDFKEDVSVRLLCLEPPDNKHSWPGTFIRLFDAIFRSRRRCEQGKPPHWRYFISWRTFGASCLASIVAVSVVLAITVTVGPLSESIFTYDLENVLLVGIFACLINFFPDYLSLLETRYLLSWIRNRPTVTRLTGLIVIDVIVTATIFLLFAGLALWLDGILRRNEPEALFVVLGRLLTELDAIMWLRFGFIEAFGVPFYSTFLTSIWLWLFGVSYLVISVFSRTEPLLRVTKYVLPIDERPFRSLGIIAGLLAMLGYWVVAVFQ